VIASTILPERCVGQRPLELRYLLDRHEVILGSGKDQHIVLDPLRGT
jgi:hypothetical protein